MSDLTIREKILLEYPLPVEASIWESGDLDSLLVSCLDDCQSDLELYESVEIHHSPYVLPEGTRGVTSAKSFSLMQTQSNSFVKHTFDKSTRQVACRFLPALVTYKRDVLYTDLNNLKGVKLQYFKAYVIVKMLDKEIAYLSVIRLESTTGSVDLDALQKVRDKLEDKLGKFKEDILFPSNG